MNARLVVGGVLEDALAGRFAELVARIDRRARAGLRLDLVA